MVAQWLLIRIHKRQKLFGFFLKDCFQHKLIAYDLFTTYHQMHHLARLAQHLGYLSAQCSKTTTNKEPVQVQTTFIQGIYSIWGALYECLCSLIAPFSCFTVNCLMNRCISMYFKSILTHNDMPEHKRDTCRICKITFCLVDTRSKGSMFEAGLNSCCALKWSKCKM